MGYDAPRDLEDEGRFSRPTYATSTGVEMANAAAGDDGRRTSTTQARGSNHTA